MSKVPHTFPHTTSRLQCKSSCPYHKLPYTHITPSLPGTRKTGTWVTAPAPAVPRTFCHCLLPCLSLPRCGQPCLALTTGAHFRYICKSYLGIRTRCLQRKGTRILPTFTVLVSAAGLLPPAHRYPYCPASPCCRCRLSAISTAGGRNARQAALRLTTGKQTGGGMDSWGEKEKCTVPVCLLPSPTSVGGGGGQHLAWRRWHQYRCAARKPPACGGRRRSDKLSATRRRRLSRSNNARAAAPPASLSRTLAWPRRCAIWRPPICHRAWTYIQGHRASCLSLPG